MREIKIQVLWERNNSDFTKSIEAHYTTVDRLCSGDDKFPYDLAKVVAKRQYAGLKDKNGVEIYEGDVVECWDTCGFEEVSQSLHGEVTFNGGCFCVADNKEYHNRLALTCAEYVEVIGNIHQNPELLEK